MTGWVAVLADSCCSADPPLQQLSARSSASVPLCTTWMWHLLGGAEGDHTPVEQQNQRKLLACLVQVVRGDQHCDAMLLDTADQPQNDLLAGQIQPGQGFVHQQQLGFLGQRACQKDPLQLAP